MRIETHEKDGIRVARVEMDDETLADILSFLRKHNAPLNKPHLITSEYGNCGSHEWEFSWKIKHEMPSPRKGGN